jgi:hypothetical protein
LPGASAEPAVKVFRDGGSATLLISREEKYDGQAAGGGSKLVQSESWRKPLELKMRMVDEERGR